MMSSPLPARKMPRKPCSGQNIKVFVRCRPMNTQEKVGRSHSLVECHSGRDIVVRERPHDKFTKTFSFDKVFAPDSKQLDVYKCVAKPLVDEVLNGFNCTIFAYGQTGTGKTFTMEGERTEDCTTWQEDPLAGVIPRCVNHLFDELRIQKLEFTMRVSFLELYNEELFDLLSKQDDLSKLRLYEDSSRKGSCIIQGLEEVLVHSKSDVYNVIEKGSAKRQTAATLMNAHSSRSHTVFTVTIHIKENTDDGDELLKTGKLHLVDLAGSENIGRSGAVDKRAREAGNINQSLLTLGRVITSLVEKAPHVPYRESKLTRLLQDALGGRTKTSIIATVSPASINLEETLSTLDYAHRAKNITNKPEVNQKLHKKELIREYTEEIERLRLDLLAMREKNGVYLANENYQEMVETMEQQAKEITEKIAHIRTVEDELEKKTDLFLETNRLLGERTEKLEETTENLSKTRLTLRSTQTVLHHTAQERDEQKYLVAAHSKTEGALHSHSRSLINVADTTTSHVQLLHQKIDRKRTVEEHNSEETVNFETNFSNQVSSMQQTLSDFKTTHAEALNTLAADHGRAVSSLESSVSASVSELSGLGAAVTQLMGTLKGLVSRAALSGTNASQELSDAASSSSKAEMARLAQYRSEELQPLLEAVTALTVRHNTTAAQLRDTVAAKSAEWRESCLSRHLSHNEHSAALVAKLQAQLERFTVHAEQHMKRVRSIGEHTTKHTQNAEECVDHLLTLHSQQLAQLKAYSEHLAAYNEQAAACEEEHLRALQEASQEHAQVLECVEKESGHSADHSNDADNRHRALADQMDTLHKQVVSSAEEVSSRSEALCGSVGICLQQTSDGLAALAEKQRLRHEELHKEAATVQEEAVCVSETDAASVYSVLSLQCTALSSASSDALEHGHALRQTVATLATQHQDALAEHDLHLQERQGELHELFNVKMTKDVPTDLTPARQDYVFSRTLVATSPHERLLRRFRSMHTTHYASKQPLPQTQDSELEGNSFSSLDNSGNDPSIIDSAMCSDNEGTPGTAAECYASLAEVKDAIEKSNEFVIPSTPMMVVRQNSREDSGVFTSGIPAPVRSAPVSRSSSVSSLTDAKENRSLINGASSCGKKKRDLRSANQTGSDKQGNGEAVEGSGRPSRRVLGPQN